MLKWPKKHIQKSIGLQIFWAKTVLIFAVVAVISITSIQHQKRLLSEELEDKASLLSDVLSNSSRLAVYSENRTLINQYVEGVINNNAIEEIIVFNDEMEVLVHRQQANVSNDKDKTETHSKNREVLSQISGKSGGRDKIVVNTEKAVEIWRSVIADQRLEDASYPDENSQTEILGYTKISLGRNQLNSQIRNTIKNHIWAGGLIWLISLLLSYRTSKNITKPIKRLTAAVKKMEKQGFGQPVPVETENEIGKLAEAFNQMSRTLFYRGKEKKRLEEQVWQNYREDVAQGFLKSIATDFEGLLSIMATYTRQALKGTKGNAKNHKILSELLLTNQKALEIVTNTINRNFVPAVQKPTKLIEVVQSFIHSLEKKIPRPIIKSFSTEQDGKKEVTIQDPYSLFRAMNDATAYVLNGNLPKMDGGITFVLESTTIDSKHCLAKNAKTEKYHVITILNEPSNKPKELVSSLYLNSKSVENEERGNLFSILQKIVSNDGEMTILQFDGKKESRGIRFYFPEARQT